MAEIRCPMCGKPNPDDRETCSFCQARLKPLVVPPADTPPIPAGQEPLKKATSDLERASLGGGEAIPAGQEPTKKNTAELEQTLPAWLRSLRESGESEPPAAGPAEPSPDESLPFSSPAPSAPDEELPDWLAGLGAQAEEEEELPDWLSGIRGKAGETTGIPASEEPITHPLVGAETLDRLTGETGEPFSEPPDYEIASGRLETAVGGPEPAADEEIPAWLRGAEAESGAPQQPAISGETPDWLSNLQAPPAAETPAASAVEVPDWLSTLQAPPAGESQPEAAAPAEALPDWLAQLDESAAAEVPPAASAPAFSESLPDWLSGAAVEPASAGEAPLVPPIIPEEEQPAAPEGSSGLLPETPAGPLPDWLAGVETSAAPPESAAPAFVMDAGGEELPPDQGAPVFAMETPDWLSSLRPEEGPQPAEGGTAPLAQEEKEIAPAELPSWVQAMRPVEAVVSQVQVPEVEEEQPAESQGPLAGLRGVLPATPGLGALRKPPAYSIKLKVDEAQQRYAAYLEQLVARENQPRRPAARQQIGAANLLRWLITACLLLVVGAAVFSGVQLHGVNQFSSPPDVAAASDLVNGLPDNAPVLIAFDYQPALAGEMEASASPLMHHLLYRGARLTFVSTTPMGPALAEHFMGRLAETHVLTGRYLDLGYLAGGPTGVFDFVLDPLSFVPPPGEAGAPDLRQSVPLQGIQRLSDYALIVVLTDDADTGRVWIEQTTAAGVLEETPLVMVVSAQAEPMMRPYYDSHQVDGMVSGLAGGRFYEERVALPVETAAPYWSAFSLGLLLIVIALAVGGAWNAVNAWRSRAPAPEEEEED